MLIQPIDYFLLGWFSVAALCTAYVAIDQYRNNPEPVVMTQFGRALHALNIEIICANFS